MIMIVAALLARLRSLGGGVILSRGAMVVLMLVIGATCYWWGMAHIHGMIREARAAALAERDAYWRAQIEASNAAIERARAENALAAARASAEAEQTIAGLQTALANLETQNAKLPYGRACGLDVGRVRLLAPR